MDITIATVVAHTKLEGIEDLALQSVGELSEPEAELRNRLDELQIAGTIRRNCLRTVLLQPSEGIPAPVLQGVETSADALAELRGGRGVSISLVGRGQLVEEELLAARETLDLVLQALDVG